MTEHWHYCILAWNLGQGLQRPGSPFHWWVRDADVLKSDVSRITPLQRHKLSSKAEASRFDCFNDERA